MSTIIKKILCIFLALIFVFTLAGCNETAKVEDDETGYLYDPREDEGYVKDGFAFRYSITTFRADWDFRMAYKCPDVIDPENETFPIELFYGHLYSEKTSLKEYQDLSTDIYSIEYAAENEDFHALEEHIPADDFKNYYVIEKRYIEENIYYVFMNFGHSKTYNIPTSVFKEGASSITLTIRAHRMSSIVDEFEIKMYYSLDDGVIKIYTSEEYADLTAGKDIVNKKIKDLREEFKPLTVDPSLENKLDYYKGALLRDEGKLKIGFTDIYHHDTDKAPHIGLEYLIACKIPEEISADDTALSIDLYYGYYGFDGLDYTQSVYFPHRIIAYTPDGAKITLEESITPEEFASYLVVPHNFNYKYSDSLIGETVIYESQYIFHHNETYEIDSSWLSGDNGCFTICVTIPHTPGSTFPDGSKENGFSDSVTVFYVKQDSKIKFYTYSEYSELIANH